MMMGSRNSVPIRRKACERGEAAASHRLMTGGTMFGHRLMPRPRKHIAKRPMAAKNGAASRPLSSERHSHNAMNAVAIGSGARYARFGHENQRSAILGSVSGVQMLTIAMKAITPVRARRAHVTAQSWIDPSVLMTSQVDPSRM